jgi:hypothetical protein
MFIKGRVREDERKSFVKVINYAIPAMSLQPIAADRQSAISLDISNGGMGIIAGFPLEQGQVLAFENEILITPHISKRGAVVQWTEKMNDKYRVGLKFV